MFNFKERPHNLLLTTAIIVFITGQILSGNLATDIRSHDVFIYIHDTYYDFSIKYLLLLPTIILVFCWVLYLFTKDFLYSKIITWIHIILTIVCAICTYFFYYYEAFSLSRISNSPDGNHDGLLLNYTTFKSMNTIILYVFMIFTVAQLLYFVNLLVGVYKKKKLCLK